MDHVELYGNIGKDHEENKIVSTVFASEEMEEIAEAFKEMSSWNIRIGYLINFYFNRHGLKFVNMQELYSTSGERNSNLMGSKNLLWDMAWSGNIFFEKICKK